MKEQNWAPKYLFGYKGFWPVEFMKALGPDSDYICHDGFWSESFPYPGAKELGAAFTAAHDGATSVSIGLSVRIGSDPLHGHREGRSVRTRCG